MKYFILFILIHSQVWTMTDASQIRRSLILYTRNYCQISLQSSLEKIRLQLSQPDYQFEQEQTVFKELRAKGFLSPTNPCESSFLDFKKNKSGSYQIDPPPDLSKILSSEKLKKVQTYLMDSDLMVRQATFDYVSKLKDYPMKGILKAIMHEDSLPMLRRLSYFMIHRNFFREKIPRTPAQFKKRLLKFINQAKGVEDRALALYLQLSFLSKARLEDRKTLVYCIQNRFPLLFLVKLLRTNSLEYLHSLRTPLQNGLGNRQREILEIFEYFVEDQPIRESIRFCLKNIHLPHLRAQRELILRVGKQAGLVLDDSRIRNSRRVPLTPLISPSTGTK